MKKIKLENLTFWYSANLEKLVFLLLVVVLFTLTAIYIPFLNVFITPIVGFVMCMVVWYALFLPNIEVLVCISLIAMLIAIVATFFPIGILLDVASQLLYILIIFILVNFIREEIRSFRGRLK
jgi:hypothetical protein